MKTIKLLLIFLILGFYSDAQIVDLQNGLLGSWFLDGNAKDESGNGNNGIAFNTVLTQDRNGNKNSAYYFNGKDSYIDLGPISTGSSYSIAVWCNIKANRTTNPIITKRHDEYSSSFTLIVSEGKPYAQIDISGGGRGSTFSKQNIADGSWHFIVATKNGGTYKLFIDNKLEGSFVDNSIVSSRNNLHLGHHGALDASRNRVTYPGWFWGSLDDLRIYNRELNEDEINSLYFIDNSIKVSSQENVSGNSFAKDDFKKNSASLNKQEVDLSIDFSNDYTRPAKTDFGKYEVSAIKKLAKKGDLASLVILGDMYFFGYDNLKIDELEAISNYKKAADQDNAVAQYKLAAIYRQNNATIIDAIKYYNKAAGQNYEPAIFDLAILYLNGFSGISKDFSKAKELLQKLPSNVIAKTELAKLYLSSDITLYNLKADLSIAKTLFYDAGHEEIYSEWVERLTNFGKFRYALFKLPTLLNGINTEIDYENELLVKTLIDQISLKSDLLGTERVNAYAYELIDNLKVINTIISKQYEDEHYQTAIKSKSASKLTAFVSRFPNSIYRKSAIDEITNLDNEKYKQAKSNNTTYSYQQYLNLFPLGLNADEAQNKIKAIDQEEKLALEKQLEETRLEKVKERQDKINAEYEYEQNRKNSIKTATIGDRLCFSQGWTRKESFLFQKYTAANYTMSIICFIERTEGENYQVRIADVSSNKSGEYSSPNINGVKVSKGDVIWVKPLKDANWHKCD
jgi:hypothetical protein